MIRDTNPPEAGRRESGVSEPKTTLFGEAIFQKIRGCFNHVFSEHDTVRFFVGLSTQNRGFAGGVGGVWFAGWFAKKGVVETRDAIHPFLCPMP
jgi:hypothetical protein